VRGRLSSKLARNRIVKERTGSGSVRASKRSLDSLLFTAGNNDVFTLRYRHEELLDKATFDAVESVARMISRQRQTFVEDQISNIVIPTALNG
jgi:hypothetical protein